MFNASGDAANPPCADNPDLWFATRGKDVADAKRKCQDCPFKMQCLTTAVDEGIEYGTWGGVSAVERKRRLGEGRVACVACKAHPSALSYEEVGRGRWPVLKATCAKCGITYRAPYKVRDAIDSTHGKAVTFEHYGCRCEPCHRASLDDRKARYRAKKAAS